MRKLLFRAWDEAKKQMVYSNKDRTVWAGGIYASVNADGLGNQLFSTEHVMQFTGLQDKNKVDIYEGDIVQRGVIVFHDGKFQGQYFGEGGQMYEMWEDDLCQERNLEVLGNIYQNPELLNP